jgi:YebC/PmpR family DNA-binding regulatory protein
MAGHSKWAQIKHKKSITDKKRGQIFSKLLKAITIAAKEGANPQFNARLRAAIEKAKENQVPQDNIERAIKKASETGENLEDLLIEAYGPEGSAILIEAITDNRNRTVAEIKKILKDYEAKWADPGSVMWAFEKIDNKWQAKFPQKISDEGVNKLNTLLEALDDHDDVENIITNIAEN